MTALLFQPQITIRGTSAQLTVTQDEEDWLDVSDYAEAVFWIDVPEVSASGGALVTLALETSPNKDENCFLDTYPPIPISSSVLYSFSTGPLVVKTVRTPLTVPLAKWLRWKLVQSGSQPWDVTFRIRCKLLRQNSFVPTDLTGCQLWLRADLGIGLDATTGNVNSWADQSGPNNASQGTPAKEPTYSPSAMNGFPAIHGDGTRFLSTANSIAITTNATLFAAVQAGSTSEGTNHVRIMETSFSSNYYLGCDQSGTAYQFIVNDNTSPFGHAQTGANTITTTNQLVTGWYQGSPGTGTIYLNGASVASDSFTAPTSTLPLFIMSSPSNTLLWTGYVGEIVIYNRALSNQELIRVHRYLGARYGVSVP